MGERKLGGDIVAVHGGHILRSTGRKDRHSKVCTAKGPRDRRVRLAARTAIQFYDVQDRLGYDRPSKAVDWLINKAKAAIDELEKLPAWDPTAGSATGIVGAEVGEGRIEISDVSGELIFTVIGGRNGAMARNSSVSVDSDAINGGTSNSVLPIEANSSATSHFQRFSNPFQNPLQQVILSGIPLGFDGEANWPEHRQEAAEINRFQNLPYWNSGGISPSESESGGYLFNSPPAPQHLFGNEQLFSQRGPLQSSFTSSIRSWIDPAMADNSHHQPPPPPPLPPPRHEEILPIYPPSLPGIGFGGFSGFQIPARIQGAEEEHHASSNYRS